jgi:hypothetical protein
MTQPDDQAQTSTQPKPRPEPTSGTTLNKGESSSQGKKSTARKVTPQKEQSSS